MLAGVMGLNACSAQDSDSARAPSEANSSNVEARLADAAARKNLVELVTGNEQFSTLASLLSAADLVSVVESGEFTVLAPTNEAFAKLPQAVVDYLLANKDALRDVLLYHVVAGSAKAEAVLASDTLTAANGKALDVNLRDGKPFINDSGIITTDILASNGVVHVIDTVLVPPGFEIPATPALPNLVDLVVEGEQFSTLEALLIQAELVDVVKSGEYTVLAPTDAAFAKLPKAVVDYLLSNKEALRDVLLYHVVAGSAKAEAVLASETLTAANGDTLDVNLRDGKPFINDSALIATDVLASNGVVHVIDSVLVPPGFQLPSAPALPNLVDLVVNGEQFTTLETLLGKAELVDAVKNGEFTVFAPTDAAFAKLPQAVVDYLLSNKAALQQVLLYHVVAGTNAAEKVLQSPTLTSAAGPALTISLRNGKPFINDSEIVATDVFASNGVVHVIDTVLVPPGFTLPQTKPNIVDAVKSNPNFSILGDLLARTGLTETIAQGKFTVFAPTNAAFHAFFRSRGVKSLDQLDAKTLKALTNVLTYHAVPGRLDAKALKSSRFLTTANGQKLKIARFGSHLFVNGICLSLPGLDLENGIVYPIESVLLPKSH
jgi:transforming growth factor-beta-induced protein